MAAAARFELKVKPFLSVLAFTKNVLDRFGKSGQNYGLVCTSKHSLLIAEVGATSCVLDVTEHLTASTPTEFGVDPVLFQSLLANRANIGFSVNKGMITFESKAKGSKYSGQVVCPTFSTSLSDHAKSYLKASKSKDGATFIAEGKAMYSLLKAIEATSIQPLYPDVSQVQMAMVLKNKKLTVTAFDNYHAARCVIEQKVSSADFECLLPSDYVGILSKAHGMFPDDKHCIAQSQKTFQLYGNLYRLTLPVIQGAELSVSKTDPLFARFKSPDISFNFDRSTLQTTIDNLSSISDTTTAIEVAVESEKFVRFRVKTDYGQVEDAIKVDDLKMGTKSTKNGNSSLSPFSLHDCLSRVVEKEASLHLMSSLSPKLYGIRTKIKSVGDVEYIGLQMSAQK